MENIQKMGKVGNNGGNGKNPKKSCRGLCPAAKNLESSKNFDQLFFNVFYLLQRVLVKEEIKEGGLDNIDWDEMIEAQQPSEGPVMFPAFTQRIRVERVEYSSEVKHRVEIAPCIKDLLEIRRLYLKKKEREDKEEAIRQEKRQIMEEKRLQLEESIREGRLAIAPDIDDEEKDEDV